MTAVHAAVGGGMALLFAAAGALGAWRWWRVEPSVWFWRFLRAAQVQPAIPLIGALLDRRIGRTARAVIEVLGILFLNLTRILQHDPRHLRSRRRAIDRAAISAAAG